MNIDFDQRLQMTLDFLKMFQSAWVGQSQVEGFITYFSINEDDLEAKIFILTRLLDMVRNAPTKIFSSDDARLRVIDAIQTSIDQLIEEEDELNSQQ